MATENVLATQATVGMIASLLLQGLKKLSWVSAVNDNSSKLNHVILAITSALGALSIHMVWNASAHSLTITGLDAMTIVSSVWLWAKQWTIQYLVHRGAFGPVATKP